MVHNGHGSRRWHSLVAVPRARLSPRTAPQPQPQKQKGRAGCARCAAANETPNERAPQAHTEESRAIAVAIAIAVEQMGRAVAAAYGRPPPEREPQQSAEGGFVAWVVIWTSRPRARLPCV